MGAGQQTLLGAAAVSVFSPSDVSGMTLWLKADAITGKVDGDLIDQWDDSSGNGNHFTSSGGLRPTYKVNVENGKPGLLFSGAQRLTGTNYGNLVSTGAHTVFVVVRLPDYSLVTSQGFIADSSFSRWVMYSAQPTGDVRGRIFTSAAVELSAGAPTDGSVVLLDMRHNASALNLQVKRNGGTVTSGGAASQSIVANATEIGGSSAASRYLAGYIFEIIVYNVAVSDANRTNVRSYLAAEYGFTYS